MGHLFVCLTCSLHDSMLMSQGSLGVYKAMPVPLMCLCVCVCGMCSSAGSGPAASGSPALSRGHRHGNVPPCRPHQEIIEPAEFCLLVAHKSVTSDDAVCHPVTAIMSRLIKNAACKCVGCSQVDAQNEDELLDSSSYLLTRLLAPSKLYVLYLTRNPSVMFPLYMLG